MNKRQYLKSIELLERRVYGEFMDAIKARVDSASPETGVTSWNKWEVAE